MVDVPEFQRLVYDGCLEYGREFHWRTYADNPYYVLVSEIMLQQTQTHRVAPKYLAFIQRFPDFSSLAEAPLSDVLALWQGLGYNRRARALQECAVVVTEQYDGELPSEEQTLRSLPGIGSYTTGALLAFAFKKPAVFIETNIRSVFLHHFFPERQGVHDKEILPLVAATLDTEDPRRWYYALMDYGVALKAKGLGHNGKSAHYKRQSRFEGSKRQVRGAIVRSLVTAGPLTEEELMARNKEAITYLAQCLLDLKKERLIVEEEGRYRIRD